MVKNMSIEIFQDFYSSISDIFWHFFSDIFDIKMFFRVIIYITYVERYVSLTYILVDNTLW